MVSLSTTKSGGKHFDRNIDNSWKTFYDAKDSLRQVEQRLQNTLSTSRNGRTEPISAVPIHSYDNLSSPSSSYLSIHAGNQTMLQDDIHGRSSRVNNYYHPANSNSSSAVPRYLNDSESRVRSANSRLMTNVDMPVMNDKATVYDKNLIDYRIDENKRSTNSTNLETDMFLETIRRKISKQKLAAERRVDSLNSQSDESNHYVHPPPASSSSLYFDGHQNSNIRNNNQYSTSSSLQNLHYTTHTNRHHSANERNLLSVPTNNTHLQQSQSYPSELDIVLRRQENNDHVTESRLLHGDDDVILSSDYNFQEFRQPYMRKVTKVTKEVSLTTRPTSDTTKRTTRSTSASTTIKYHDSPSLPNSDMQRLKNIRRLEPAHVTSASKTSLITPDSWRTAPVKLSKSRERSKSSSKHVHDELKKLKDDKQILPKSAQKIVEELLPNDESSTNKIKDTEKPKVSKKPSSVRVKRDTKKDIKKPVCKVVPYERPPKDQIQGYIQQKRQQHEENLLKEKRLRSEQEKQKKDKLKKLDERIQETAHLHPQLPSSSNKLVDDKQKKNLISGHSYTSMPMRSSIPLNDPSEQTRQQKLVRLLGPKPESTYGANSEQQPPQVEQLAHSISSSSVSSSSSSSSSSTSSVIEANSRPQSYNPSHRARSQPTSQIRPPLPSQIHAVNRQENLRKWAENLNHDCDNVQEKIRSFRPDGTQKFDITTPEFDVNTINLDQEGNLRHGDSRFISTGEPIYLVNQNNSDQQHHSSASLRPSGRLSRLNQNWTSEFSGNLPGVGDLKDPLLAKRIQRERAAGKIQAAYRGYSVRKSLQWSIKNDNYKNRQSTNKNKKSYQRYSHPPTDDLDLVQSMDFKFNDDNYTIGSTILKRYEHLKSDTNNSQHTSATQQYKDDFTSTISSAKNVPIVASRTHQPRQPLRNQHQKKSHSPLLYSDDYENYTSTSSSPVHNQKKKHINDTQQSKHQPSVNLNEKLRQTSISSPSSSTSTPTIQDDEEDEKIPQDSHIFKNLTETQRRRSSSPPLPPQMSPDSGRPINPSTTIAPLPSQSHHRSIHHDFEDKRFSPDALERQLNAEFNLLEGVEQSMIQIDNMEKMRSLALAQQEVVSIAQVLRNTRQRDSTDNEQLHSKQLQSRKSPSHDRPQQQQSTSSSSSTSSPSHSRNQYDRYSPLVQQQYRRTNIASPPTSSSESSLIVRFTHSKKIVNQLIKAHFCLYLNNSAPILTRDIYYLSNFR
ncbi:unnamed protein product [Didymodactylos carnosus]|uniref:Uncharacterized protein n=1 Tax=Didymodactylos carnosus TaxID=1234261 RepID=A0A814RHX7_9BILA|nr:unnamed protein product [Didymodactylos carnosus]CAF1134255.1 unnamed protein product [Didymodactylos carnosus]CAF3837729.1 unnamed protein product [Didymodactylos carnosus]CAF3898019.1 unnamed protein product [Didymodactylos carnosus]